MTPRLRVALARNQLFLALNNQEFKKLKKNIQTILDAKGRLKLSKFSNFMEFSTSYCANVSIAVRSAHVLEPAQLYLPVLQLNELT